MITRRALILIAALPACLPPRSRTARASRASRRRTIPPRILTAIYTRAAKGKGDGGGAFVIENKAREGEISVEIAGRAVGQGRRPYAEGRCRADRFRSRHQFAGAGRQIVQGCAEKLEADKATHRGDHHRPSARRESPPTSRALRFRARGRPVEDRRHQGLARRRGLVDPQPCSPTRSNPNVEPQSPPAAICRRTDTVLLRMVGEFLIAQPPILP